MQPAEPINSIISQAADPKNPERINLLQSAELLMGKERIDDPVLFAKLHTVWGNATKNDIALGHFEKALAALNSIEHPSPEINEQKAQAWMGKGNAVDWDSKIPEAISSFDTALKFTQNPRLQQRANYRIANLANKRSASRGVPLVEKRLWNQKAQLHAKQAVDLALPGSKEFSDATVLHTKVNQDALRRSEERGGARID